MKKMVEVEQTFCDICGKEAWDPCLKCGKDFCWECKEKHGVIFPHSVTFSGSGDGFYCHDCEEKMASEKKDQLYLAYLEIDLLRRQHKAWYEDFERRSGEAERYLEKLRKERE